MSDQLSLLEWAPIAPARRKVRNSVAAAASLGASSSLHGAFHA